MLLQTLKTVAANPNIDPTESANIGDVIVNVGLKTPVKRMTDWWTLV